MIEHHVVSRWICNKVC